MAKGCVFVVLVCFALANYAAGQGNDSDQCQVYKQGYPAYYTCIIKCFQFVLGFNASTASFCTNKFRLTKASLDKYTNTHAVNILKCIAIKCREFVPEDVCEDSSPGIGSSTDFRDFTTALITTPFIDNTNSGLSTSVPSSSGTTVADSTSPGQLSTSGSSVNTPPSVTKAGITSSLSPNNPVPSTTPSLPADDASQILQSTGEEQPSDSDECDEDGDDMDGDTSSPDDGSFASTTFANSGGDSSSASAATDSSSGDDSSANAGSDSSDGDSSSESADLATSDGDNSYANSASDSSSGDDSSANAASSSSDGDSSSASAVSTSGGEDSASASAASVDNDGDDSSTNTNSDLDFFYYFIYDDDDEQSNSTFNSNSSNPFSTSIQPSQSTPQPSIDATSSETADGYLPESPDDTSNDDKSPGDETSDNQFDAGNKYYDYAAAEAVADQDESGSYSFSDFRGGNNNPQLPQNPNWARPAYYPPQAPAYNPQQAPAFNPQQAQVFNTRQAEAFNPRQEQAFNPQQAQAFNPQQAQAFNPQQAEVYNPQQMPNWNNNNNWNYAQQNRRQQIPIRNKWNRRQQGLLPVNNNQGYQWNQGNVNNNEWQGNLANIPPANNGRFWRNRVIQANNMDY